MKIVEKSGGTYTIVAAIYGQGIKMYLLSQGAWMKVTSPLEFVEEMRQEVEKLHGFFKLMISCLIAAAYNNHYRRNRYVLGKSEG